MNRVMQPVLHNAGFDTRPPRAVKFRAVSESVRVRAAAKINLHLRVLKPMADGFHGIESLFQAIGLHDRIVIRSLTHPGIRVRGDFDCDPSRTTVYRAAERYLSAAGIVRGFEINVDKRIPVQAGLGGGSSDAAALLAGLQVLCGSPLNDAALADIGASVGSDVPFFLGTGAAVVSGRGEQVRSITPRTDFGVLVIKPGFGSSTPEAYRLLDRARQDGSYLDPEPAPPLQGPDGLAARYAQDPERWGFYNSFQPVLDARAPEYGAAREAMLSCGATVAMLSGSGSALFGIYADPAQAEAAMEPVSRKLAAWPEFAPGRAFMHAGAALACPLEVD